MTFPLSTAEQAPLASPPLPSPRLRAALGELLLVGVNRAPDVDDRLSASLAWICRAQDVDASGAVSGGFRLLRGWRAADVDSTFAAVSAFAEAAEPLGESHAERRSRRAARALCVLPATSDAPRVAAVALRGLCAWTDTARMAERRAALSRTRSLVAPLEESLERRHSDTNGALPLTEAATISAALCAAAESSSERRLADVGERLLDDAMRGTPVRDVMAALARQPGARWPQPRGVAALPFVLRDLREVGLRLDRRDILSAVDAEAETLLRRFELRRQIAAGLPRAVGRRALNRFSPLAWAASALFWIEESERTDDPRPLNAALFALDALYEVQRTRPGVEDVDGAVPATVRTWRDRRVPSYDSLTAVTLTRAMIGARRLLSRFEMPLRSTRWRVPPDVPRAVRAPVSDAAHQPAAPRVVLYAAPDIHRAPRLLEQWREWGFSPAAVIMERRPRPPLVRRVRRRIADDGWRAALDRIARRARPRADRTNEESTADFCARVGIPLVEVGALDAPETVAAIRELAPDLAIHVGTGILRAPLLEVPRLGTLNIHNGFLPRFRGVNVAEWSALLGEPVGCTVHLVDPGVDTGDILFVREVDARGVRSIDELRRLVDRAQGAILGEVLRAITTSGSLPPRRRQNADEGKQFFRMHPALRERLENRLTR